ncbi:MAG: MFS transporter [Candidatus Bathyarchaeota archaeon]|nr:MFS transporter [Candidatus Bathyarchaeota archaeon]
MWRLGTFFHEMAYGLLSVFIPLYIVTSAAAGGLGGSLVDLGIIMGLSVAFTIPSSYFWGWICDRMRRYKMFILLSFFSSAIILFLFTIPFARNLVVFGVLYILMNVLHNAHESPKNVLVAENYSHDQWGRAYAIYEGLTEVGLIIGLGLGIAAFSPTINFGTNAMYTFYICSSLSLVAFVISLLFVADPIMNFERRLVGIERNLDYSHRGFEAVSRMWRGYGDNATLKQTRFLGFGLAILFFSLATAVFYTPLPVFFTEYLGLDTGSVFIAYVLGSIGATSGYFAIRNRAFGGDTKKRISRMILLRSFFVFLIVAVVGFSFYPLPLAGMILIGLGFAFAIYSILMLCNAMALVPEGKSGISDVLAGLGAAIGAFTGPYLAEVIGYLPAFLIAALLFLVAFVCIKVLS